MKARYGYVCGDINWGGVLNLAIDLKGENILMDMILEPEKTHAYFYSIARVVERFFSYIYSETKTTSISVNRVACLLEKPVYIHSECSHTMISEDDYRSFLLPIDMEWSEKYRPYGIHYCGKDPHRHAANFAEIPQIERRVCLTFAGHRPKKRLFRWKCPPGSVKIKEIREPPAARDPPRQGGHYQQGGGQDP